MTANFVKHAKPGRQADGGGLYLEVDLSGARRWILRTTVAKRRRDIGLGGCSYVTLAEAREKAAQLRKIAKEGGNPIAERDREKRQATTFEDAARRAHEKLIVGAGKNGKHVAQWISTLETYAFPRIGATPLHMVEQANVIALLSPIRAAKPETAKRVRQRIRVVFEWARPMGLFDGMNPADGIESSLVKVKTQPKHHAALPYADLPALWKRLEAAKGMGAAALRFTILTAARSGETRGAAWAEIDLDEKTWTIPAERMKAGAEHRVPLSEAALAILRMVKPLANRPDALVFASRSGKPLSDMTLSAVLRRLEVPVTVHGFRSTFRDWTEERGSWPHEVKEAALAHQVKSKVERAYRRTDLFEKRIGMMDAWASFMTGAEGQVVRLRA